MNTDLIETLQKLSNGRIEMFFEIANNLNGQSSGDGDVDEDDLNIGQTLIDADLAVKGVHSVSPTSPRIQFGFCPLIASAV